MSSLDNDRSAAAQTALPAPARTALVSAYVLYLACVVYLVWSPSPGAPGTAVTKVGAALARVGVVVSGGAVEFGLNVVMLVPLSLLGGLLLPRLRVTDWLAVGFCLSLVVEVVQRLVLPTRSGSSRDIVANTLGSLIGAVLLVIALALLDRHTRSRASARAADDAERGGGRKAPRT